MHDGWPKKREKHEMGGVHRVGQHCNTAASCFRVALLDMRIQLLPLNQKNKAISQLRQGDTF